MTERRLAPGYCTLRKWLRRGDLDARVGHVSLTWRRFGNTRTRPAELSCTAALFTGAGAPHKWRLTGPSGEVQVVVDGRLWINNIIGIRAAAFAGVGLAVLPYHLVGPDLRRGDLVQVLPEYPPVPVTLCAVYPVNRHVSSKVRVFIDFLVERFGDSNAWESGDLLAESNDSARNRISIGALSGSR